jgi:hypothetical protein
MRLAISSCLVTVLLACGGEPPAAPAGGDAGSSTSGGSTSTSGGSTSTSGGSTATYGGAPPVYSTYGGSDNGSLLGPNAVPFDPSPQGGSGGTGGSGGSAGSGPSGDGNVATCTWRRGLSGTVTFTQTGTDVTAVVDITGGCPGGEIELRIHDGYSCDNADTEGVPWGERGEMGTVTCDGSSASATFTRPGTDSNTNWTVADHNLDTDISGHVLIATPVGDSANRIACGNFF